MKFHKPKNGEMRNIRRFAFFPISDDEDTYWLEWVDIEQEYLVFITTAGITGWYNTFVVGDTDKKEAR